MHGAKIVCCVVKIDVFEIVVLHVAKRDNELTQSLFSLSPVYPD